MWQVSKQFQRLFPVVCLATSDGSQALNQVKPKNSINALGIPLRTGGIPDDNVECRLINKVEEAYVQKHGFGQA